MTSPPQVVGPRVQDCARPGLYLSRVHTLFCSRFPSLSNKFRVALGSLTFIARSRLEGLALRSLRRLPVRQRLPLSLPDPLAHAHSLPLPCTFPFSLCPSSPYPSFSRLTRRLSQFISNTESLRYLHRTLRVTSRYTRQIRRARTLARASERIKHTSSKGEIHPHTTQSVIASFVDNGRNHRPRPGQLSLWQ